jgi:predicted glycogen debranching enzyme
MVAMAGHWSLELPVVETGYFQAKAYLIDAHGHQFWPDGPNVGITVHPDQYRTGNTLYCAFARLFGDTKYTGAALGEAPQSQLLKLDKQGFAVIPPSGKLRDLCAQLPHIVQTLGCRIVHLLPVNPTPTTYARFGRFGSPYAAQDLTAIDPALVDFDRRTTGIDQFRELTYQAHLRGARVFLDIVTNHTGWGSILQENNPEWFLRHGDGTFASPGAWGVTWEDLVELDHRNPASWEHLADVFLIWCRRGVDGFRCDAGYKVPMPAWRYIAACVRQEYPETIFLLEGLGGPWEATETLLTEGGMQWAYSELFQNYTGEQVSDYLGYAHHQSARVGLYVHYSETHDNERLARKGRPWSLLRNQLCALSGISGGYGFTCGVEWLASERINVHGSPSLNWGSADTLIPDLAKLNALLAEHPCFYDHATLTRLNHRSCPIYSLRRDSQEGVDRVLVLVNTDVENSQSILMDAAEYHGLGMLQVDLLGKLPPSVQTESSGDVRIQLAPGACYCLAETAAPRGLCGDAYRKARACAAFAVEALSRVMPVEKIGPFDWQQLAERVKSDPVAYLAALNYLAVSDVERDPISALEAAWGRHYPPVVVWRRGDVRRVVLVPPRHWLLVLDDAPFRASLILDASQKPIHRHAVEVGLGHVCCFHAQEYCGSANIVLERYASAQTHLRASVRFLGPAPDLGGLRIGACLAGAARRRSPLVLLTNRRGGMARVSSDLGRILSKYDCALAANLHPAVPVDRHVFVKRVRAWMVADRFITPLDQFNRAAFEAGPPAQWRFVANAGDGRTVEIELQMDMLDGLNTTVLRFTRLSASDAASTIARADFEVRLTVRVDLEDRNFHWETKRNPSADFHFSSHCRPLSNLIGFEFVPATDRSLRVWSDAGRYVPQPEWSENMFHPVEHSRGQADHGDAYSPGWFDLPLPAGSSATLVLCADPEDPSSEQIENFAAERMKTNREITARAQVSDCDTLGRQLVLAAHQFLARRGRGWTVIAGYPWFLDWGRDTLICARGLLAAGLVEEVSQILVTFARFEKDGTLPNSIFGEDASNRDTSDAPLWFGKVCEELAVLRGDSVYRLAVDDRGTSLGEILRRIASGYLQGTPNGIRVDRESGLVWSPPHFTWMDTNYPAGTPREGYPVEIQVLWIRLLRQLAAIDRSGTAKWQEWADRAESSFRRFYWLEDGGYLSDVLFASPGESATRAVPDKALRSNYLLAVAEGLISGERARRCVDAALRHLVVPGALRTLAPLTVSPPLPVRAADGRLLNNPNEPYWGRYEGDEDSQRKPAYHNGTAWTWTFPIFCEALVRAWDGQSEVVAAAKAYLSSVDQLLMDGCLGQLPEIVDGDAPHAQRGCDAQAWGVTEALRVWKKLCL